MFQIISLLKILAKRGTLNIHDVRSILKPKYFPTKKIKIKKTVGKIIRMEKNKTKIFKKNIF